MAVLVEFPSEDKAEDEAVEEIDPDSWSPRLDMVWVSTAQDLEYRPRPGGGSPIALIKHRIATYKVFVGGRCIGHHVEEGDLDVGLASRFVPLHGEEI
jgi:hypothetical protein